MVRTLSVLRWSILAIIIFASAGLMLYAAQTDSLILGELVGPMFSEFLFAFRLGSIALTLFLLFLVYAWTKDIIGRNWALLPVSLIAFSPSILAAGHFVARDIAALFTTFIAVITFLIFFRAQTFRATIFTGIAFGFAQFADFSGAVLVPYFILVALLYIGRQIIEDHRRDGYTVGSWSRGFRRFRSLLAVFLVGYLLLFAMYTAFGWSFETRYLSGLQAVWQNWFASRPSIEHITAFFKTEPLPALILITLALIFAIVTVVKVLLRRIRKRSEPLTGLIDVYFPEIALTIFVFLFLFLERSLIVALPIIYMLTAILIRNWFSVRGFEFARNTRAKIIILYRERFSILTRFSLLAVLVVWQLVVVVSLAPQFTRDDRGQDLGRLQEWVTEKRIEQIAVDYFGPVDVSSIFGEIAEPWWPALTNPANEGIHWLAVSKSRLEQSSLVSEDTYDWLKNEHTPHTIIGNTIYVYRFGNLSQ